MTEQSSQQGAQPPAGNVYAVGGVKYRNMAAQVALMIVTFGFYSFYWFYKTSQEMQYLAQDDNASPELWTILLFVPFGALYSWYKHSQLVEKLTQGRYETVLIYILWIFFSPAVWYLTQTDLNRKATYGRPQ